MFKLDNKTIILSGGNGFLGFHFTKHLLLNNCKIIIIDKNNLNKKLQNLKKKYDKKLFFYKIDISNFVILNKEINKIKKRFKKIDILINAASLKLSFHHKNKLNFFERFEKYNFELWQQAFDVNLTGTMLLTQIVSKNMLKFKQGNIINIASDVGIISPDHRIYEKNLKRKYKGVNFNTPASYSISKSGIISLTKFLATYWAKKGIRVNAISPAGVYNNQDKKFVNELSTRIPLGRMAKPEEICGPLIFLCSDASSFITGSNLVVDGGRTIW